MHQIVLARFAADFSDALGAVEAAFVGNGMPAGAQFDQPGLRRVAVLHVDAARGNAAAEKLLGRTRHRPAGLPRPDHENALVPVEVVARRAGLVPRRRSGPPRPVPPSESLSRRAADYVSCASFPAGKPQNQIYRPLDFAIGVDAIVGTPVGGAALLIELAEPLAVARQRPRFGIHNASAAMTVSNGQSSQMEIP